MASKPRKSTAAKVATARVASDADPQSWLFLNPAGPTDSGIVFGVLRKSYAGRTNTAAEFGWRKAHPVPPDSGGDRTLWRPTAERVDALLPPSADDALLDPPTLLRLADECAVPREKALLVYLTLPLGHVDRVHAGWELARTFVRERLVRDRSLAAMLALHAPGRIGSANPLHCHVLLTPRTAGGLGLAHGAYDADLLHDTGQAIVDALWTEHLAAFR